MTLLRLPVWLPPVLVCRCPEQCPAEVAELIEACFSLDPLLRPSAAAVMELVQESMQCLSHVRHQARV